MASRLEIARDYVISIGGRMLGRNAWEEAMSKKPLHPYFDQGNIPTWAKNLNIAIDHCAPLYAVLEFYAPISSRIFVPAMKPKNQEKYNALLTTASVALPLVADIAIWASIVYSDHNLAENIVLKLAANAATHVALDLGGAAINKIKTLRPSANILAV